MAITKLQPFNLNSTANYTFADVTASNANLASLSVTGNSNVGNLNVSGNITDTVSTLNISTSGGTNGNLALSADGTGRILLDGMAWPLADGANGYVLQTDGANSLSWSAPSIASATYVRTSFTATASQTTFTVDYTVGYAEVFLNGVLLNSTDYTASNGTTIVLGVGATLNDIVEVIAYNVTTLGTATASINIAGGTAGTIAYQSGPNVTGFTTAGTAGQLLQSNGTSAPTWVAAPSTSAAGSTGQLQYNNAGAFGAVSSGTAGQVLTSAGSGSPPTWGAAPSSSPFTFYDKTLATSSSLQTSVAGYNVYNPICVQLTSTTELVIVWGNASCHAAVWDNTAKTFGTPQLIRTATFASLRDVAAVAISSTSVLVNTLPSGGTALQTVVLSISGTTITVNSPISTTLALASSFIGSISGNNGARRCIATGSSYVLSYYNTGTVKPAFRAITVSGTVPTVGSELTFTGGNNGVNYNTILYSAGLLVHLSTSGSLLYAVPISVSGTTLTQGTQATTSSGANNFLNTGQFSSGRISAVYQPSTGTAMFGAVISVAGTTASISTVSLGLGLGSCTTQIIGNQTFVVSSGATNPLINVLTDSSGTAVAGTAVNGNQTTGAVPNAYIVGYSGSNIYVSTAQTNITVYTISGNNAVFSTIFPASISTNTTVAYDAVSYSSYFAGLENNLQLLTTTAGKIAPLYASPYYAFAFTFDGSTPGKLYQYETYSGYAQKSTLSTAAGWVLASVYDPAKAYLKRIELS